ncbi:MAG: DUF4419 domain-containing protein [Myxococcota bacterium]
MRTIPISDVEVPGDLLPALSYPAEVGKRLGRPIEQLSEPPERFVACTDVHPLAQAAHDAFFGHRPLVLSPDAVWFTLCQGLSLHVAEHAEALRERFVRHADRVVLQVERPDFALGQANPWPEVFGAFSAQIARAKPMGLPRFLLRLRGCSYVTRNREAISARTRSS